MNRQLTESLELIRSFRSMAEIEDDPAKKLRIRTAAQELVEIVLEDVEQYVVAAAENAV